MGPLNDMIFAGRGSTALFAILKSLDLAEKTILLPINVCEMVYPIVVMAGFKPIFYDVNAVTGNASLENIKTAYSGNETVLLAVHNFGSPLEIEKISSWAAFNTVFLIEDVCNAYGAKYNNTILGYWGDASIFSFGHAKILDLGIGGGAIIKNEFLRIQVRRFIDSLETYSILHKTKNIEFQEYLREVRKDLNKQTPEVYIPLYQEYVKYLLYKICPETKLFLKKQIRKGAAFVEDRRKKAALYREQVHSDRVEHIPEIEGQVYWRYNLLTDESARAELLDLLWANKIPASSWFPPIDVLFTKGVTKEKFPGGNSFANRVINLFVDPGITQDHIERTIKIINKIK